MKPSLIKLQKFFKLEAERGYDNRAVLGGLSRMLEPWEAEARQDKLPDELIAAVMSRLRDYNRLSPASRQEVLQGLWSRIQSEVEDAPPTEAVQVEGKPLPEQIQEVPATVQNGGGEVESQSAVKIESEAAKSEHEAKQEPQPEESVPEKSTPAALNAPVTVLPGVGPNTDRPWSDSGWKPWRICSILLPPPV